MNVSSLKRPDFPRIINRYRYHLRRVSLDDKEPVLVRDVKKVRVSRGVDGKKRIVFPELFSGRWRPFFVDGEVLVSSVPNMVGSVADRRLSELEVGWGKWLGKWVKLNKLGVKIEEKGGEVVEVEKKRKVDREKRKVEKEVDEEEVEKEEVEKEETSV
jgi:hypothetical protein